MPYDLRPTEAELSEARALASVALDACERTFPDATESADGSLRVALGWTDEGSVLADRRGVAGTTFPDGEVELAFNADVAGWGEAVGPEASRQFGRAWFDRRSAAAFRWQRLLREAVADRVAIRTHPDGPTPWRATDETELGERWATIREGLGERDDLPADRVTMGVAAAVAAQLFADGRDVAAAFDLDRGAVREAGDAALR